MQDYHEARNGNIYEAGRAVVQVRAVVALVNAILACLPPDAQAIAAATARESLGNDPGALAILNAGLRIETAPEPLKAA
nr:hypothetical protein [uncultured Devosia sp.]